MREAVLELFLSCKIRSDEEIDNYNKELMQLEKLELVEKTGYQLVDMIKDCIESLMTMHDKQPSEFTPQITQNTCDNLARQLKEVRSPESCLESTIPAPHYKVE